MKTLKIGIAGTHSTGKSTLVAALKKKLKADDLKVATVSDLARAARDLGFPILHNHTFESTLWIMTRGIELELATSINADVVIVDRPAPDAMGYLYAALKHRGVRLSKAQSHYLDTLIQLHSPTFDLHFKTTVDHSKGISTAKKRDHDADFRLSADTGIAKAYKKAKIKPISLPTEPEETFQVAYETVKVALKKAASSR